MRWTFLTVGILLLTACGAPEPVHIGFIGGLSGRFADLGTPGRNGAMLAVEQKNRQGGIGGRQIELLIRDDQQDSATALSVFDGLREEGVKAIIGPMTSSIAMAVVPKANDARLLMMGVTVTTASLTGQDDYFYRVIGTTSFYASHAASYHLSSLGVRKVALAMDIANRDYTESWGGEYAKTLSSGGGHVVAQATFDSRGQKSYLEIAETLLKGNPDIIVLVCSSVDGALIAQAVRKKNRQVRLAGSGWTSTERLIELGGQAVEGMIVEQYFDRFDGSPRYREFYDAYSERFGQEPGFAGVTGYDAALAVIAALERDPAAKNLKQTLVEMKRFEGVQGEIGFDANGDALRRTYLNIVRHGQFAPLR